MKAFPRLLIQIIQDARAIAALAQQRRGNAEQARTALAVASDRYDVFLRNGDLGAQAGPKWWFDAAAAIVIRAEAEQVILGREVSPRPTPAPPRCVEGKRRGA